MDTKLHESVRYSNLEGVLEAIKFGLDVNIVGILQWTPVQEAAHSGERDILFYLLSHGGDPNRQDSLHGNTALHLAAKQGHWNCLELLIKHGGRLNIKNYDGKTCSELVSREGERIIEKIIMELGTCTGEMESDHQNNNERKIIHCPVSTESDKLPEVPAPATMGFLHLSFEYHRGVLKIRVWQVSDLLLPPPQISMIYSIFVRAYMIPDQAKKTTRQTEDVMVDGSSGTRSEIPKTGIQHIFTPSSFKFLNPLLYTGVTADIVKERSLQLEVCMTQKHSRRTFLMAMVHLPLKVAVRRPIREKYPLIPCMNITIPNNMRVYSARDLQLEVMNNRTDGKSWPKKLASEQVVFPPSVQNARDSDLEEVVSISGDDFLRSHLALCLDTDDEDDTRAKEKEQDLKEVVLCAGVGSGGSSSTTLDMPSSDDESVGKDDNPEAMMGVTKGPDSSPVHMVATQASTKVMPKKKIIPNESLKKIGLEDFAIAMEQEVEKGKGLDVTTPPSADHDRDVSFSRNDVSLLAGEHVRKKIIPEKVPHFGLSLSDQSIHDAASQQNEIIIVRENHRDATPVRYPGANRSKLTMQTTVTELQKQVRAKDNDVSVAVQNGLSSLNSPAAQGSPSLDLSPFPPSSRPETPVWDYYDFDDESEPGQALEQRLAQLHPQHHLLEPVLPMTLDDDFDALDDNDPSPRPL